MSKAKKVELKKVECKGLDPEFYNEYMSFKKKTGLTHGELLQMFYTQSQQPFKCGLSARQKVEQQIRNLITQKDKRKITMHLLRQLTGTRLDAVKAVFALYTNEIEKHNSTI